MSSSERGCYGLLLLLLLVTVVVLLLVGGARGNAIGQPDQEGLGDSQGLYNASDLVVILNSTNFRSSVYASPKAWLVEFYNSWCGHCFRFAPTWKSLAQSVYEWRHIIVIAAIDCANDDNTPLCRDYEIMRYPTLKFFPVNSKEGFLGLEFHKDDDEVHIREAIIKQLIKEQLEQRGGSSWPNIVPFRGTELQSLWQGTPESIKYEFLIFEKPDSYLGAEVILDLHKLDIIRIRRITSENEYLSVTSKVINFPSLIVLDRDDSKTFLKINSNTREGIRNTILEFLKSKHVPAERLKEFIEKFNQNHGSTINAKTKIKEDESNYTEDKLYQLDLETALRHVLSREISSSPVIDGEKLKALQVFLKAIWLYFPIYLPGSKIYFQALSEIIESKKNLTGKEFKQLVDFKENEFRPVFSGPRIYIGCKGSLPKYRNFPCGLWTTFHTLTVAAAEHFINIDGQPNILIAIHGYVKNFFGCAECSNHFQEMVKRRNISEPQNPDDMVLWLWRAHNEVNERLAGDITEDPEHKKIQYPSLKNCPKCKFSTGEWNKDEVLKYLKMKYSKLNINYEGVDEKLIEPDKLTNASNSGATIRRITWDFTIFDISICVVLYATSAVILILVFIKFAFKRTVKKKTTFQNLFNVRVK